MLKQVNNKIKDYILKEKILSTLVVEQEAQEALEDKKRLDSALYEKNLITDEQRTVIVCGLLGLDYTNIDALGYDDQVVKEVTSNFIIKHKAIPLKNHVGKDGKNTYTVAIAEPTNIDIFNLIYAVFGLNTKIIVTSFTKIFKIQSLVFSKQGVSEAIKEYEGSDDLKVVTKKDDTDSEDVLSAPAVKLVESIFRSAIASDASDIHIEPYETIVRVRNRIDGVLFENTRFAIDMYNAVVARIKILSGMNIAERRAPQDGRINQIIDGVSYDFRVSSLPIVNGEKIVIRILDTTAFSFTRDKLGFFPEENKKIDELIHQPNGIILLTGPTGCGKSTTLYSFIQEVNDESTNIITVEDPVEYTMEGVNQVQINNKANMSFANALRSILRQDPNIVMIGEIRDEETAQIAIRMSITGHLVFSTLHTNDAAGAVTRLIDLGVEPFFVTDALTGVIAQRLVRRLCPQCKKEHKTTERENKLLGVSRSRNIYESVGCPACHNTGYKGRIGIHEVLVMDNDLRDLISEHVTTNEVKRKAMEKGMLTLKQTCIKYVLQGMTSIKELETVVSESND